MAQSLIPSFFIIIIQAITGEFKIKSLWKFLYVDDLVIIAGSVEDSGKKFLMLKQIRIGRS